MSEQRLSGKRILLTQADEYMGPAIIDLFSEHGAVIVADTTDLTQSGAAEAVIADAGEIYVLVANLAAPASKYSRA